MPSELAVLLLLVVANGMPVAARMLLGQRWRRALDGGRRLNDGQCLFGASKTVAGLLTALLTTALAAPLVGLAWWLGLMIGALAMVGDLLTSFIKRRLGLPSGAALIGMDQVPESLLPLLAVKPLLALSWTQVLLLTGGFVLADLLISRLTYWLGVRQHPW